jgi:Uncharacterized protein conserved in bacteria (DUF2059)
MARPRAAYVSALDAVQQAGTQTQLEDMAAYFANRLTLDEMQSTAAFYTSDFGRIWMDASKK